MAEENETIKTVEQAINKALTAYEAEITALRAENERLKSLLAVYRDCEICKHGQNPSLELEPGEEFEKHCKWCESGDDNNWELADQALKGAKNE